MLKRKKRILPKPGRRLKSKKGSWRKLRFSYQIRRKLEIFALALIVVISTVAVFLILYLWQFLRTPFVEASGSSNHNSTFEKEKRYNLCLILLEDINDPLSSIKALTVVSLNPVKTGASLISVPVEATVEEASGLGEYKISSLYALGGITEPKMNVDIVVRSISSSLAVPLDAYVLTDVTGLEEIFSELGQKFTLEDGVSLFTYKYFPKALTLLELSRKNLRTNLDFIEALKVVRFMHEVRSDRVQLLKLESEDFKDYMILDNKLINFVSDSKITEERLKVLVLNGTLIDGLAMRTSRMVSNLGGTVLDIGNSENRNQKKTILIADDEDSFTVKRLKEIFRIQEGRTRSEGLGERADIILILGLDISEIL